MGLFGKKKVKNLRPDLSVAQSEAVQNAADSLLANIRFSEVDTPVKTITVSSAAPNDGKTTIVMALAIAMGRIGKKVCLLEGDMRRRSLRRALGIHARYGLHAAVTGAATLDEAVVETGLPNVWFMDAEQGIPNPERVLNSQHYVDMLAKLSDKFDYVLIDTPPVAAFAVASLVASKTDGVVLVVRQGVTEKREAAFAVETLRNSGANLIGVCMNGENAATGGYYGYYYSYYYEEAAQADSEEQGE